MSAFYRQGLLHQRINVSSNIFCSVEILTEFSDTLTWSCTTESLCGNNDTFQPGLVITRSIITYYWTYHSNDRDKTEIRAWAHNIP